MSTHAPLQSVVVPGHAHWPEMHTPPVAQAVPQPPQLFVSVVVSTQPVGQFVWPEGHWQNPLAQCAPEPHTLLHMPQLKLSVMRLAQLPLQTESPAGQPH